MSCQHTPQASLVGIARQVEAAQASLVPFGTLETPQASWVVVQLEVEAAQASLVRMLPEPFYDIFVLGYPATDESQVGGGPGDGTGGQVGYGPGVGSGSGSGS